MRIPAHLICVTQLHAASLVDLPTPSVSISVDLYEALSTDSISARLLSYLFGSVQVFVCCLQRLYLLAYLYLPFERFTVHLFPHYGNTSRLRDELPYDMCESLEKRIYRVRQIDRSRYWLELLMRNGRQ